MRSVPSRSPADWDLLLSSHPRGLLALQLQHLCLASLPSWRISSTIKINEVGLQRRARYRTPPVPGVGVVFKLSCSPVSAKLYQASFTLLLSNEEWGGKQGAPLPARRKAPGARRHTDTACSSPLLQSGSAPRAKSYSLENGTCAKVPALIKSSFTPAEREGERGRQREIPSAP